MDMKSMLENVDRMEILESHSVYGAVSSVLVKGGLTPLAANMATSALIESRETLATSDKKNWYECFSSLINEATVTLFDNGQDITFSWEDLGIDVDDVIEVMEDTKLLSDSLVETSVIGKRLEYFLDNVKEGMNLLEELPEKRKYPRPSQTSLSSRAMQALEETRLGIWAYGLDVAEEVYELIGENTSMISSWKYVISGSKNLVEGTSYHSEFKPDNRERMYQAFLKSLNTQGGDIHRALLDFPAASRDYDKKKAIALLVEEARDCFKSSSLSKKEMSDAVYAFINDPVESVVAAIQGSNNVKPKRAMYFMRVAHMLSSLMEHKDGEELPHIGLPIGKDAKGSGPQIAGLLTNDQTLLASCGFSVQRVEDVYKRALGFIKKAGFGNMERDDIKNAFMAIFYGQGWKAFTYKPGESDKYSLEAFRVVNKGDSPNEDAARLFRQSVMKSFGQKVLGLRSKMATFSWHYGEKDEPGYSKLKEAPTYFLPDGVPVYMDYKVELNVLGEALGQEGGKISFRVECGGFKRTLKDWKVKTNKTNLYNESRNSFVNLIQAIDGLIARLIIVNLKEAGVEDIISIHDCFKVSLADYGKLDLAISKSYTELFGSKDASPTANLPFGRDILGLYFEGVNKSLVSPVALNTGHSQFDHKGNRRLRVIFGKTTSSIFNSVGKVGGSYYYE